LLYQFSHLLAEFFFHFADHLRRRAVRELLRQLSAFGEFSLDCLLFPISIHDHKASGTGRKFNSGQRNSKLSSCWWMAGRVTMLAVQSCSFT
jgi:hypothetical protein